MQEIQNNGIKPIFVPLSQDGKSSLDCYLIVSAMKLFFQNKSIDTFILASGDRDYIPLLAELKAIGKNVYILAVPGSLSNDLTRIVDGVISYTPIDKEDSIQTIDNDTDKTYLTQFVVETIKELQKTSINNRWVNLSNIGLVLKKKDPKFSHTKHGYKKLAELLDDIEQIEIKYDNYEKTVAVARIDDQGHRSNKNQRFEGIIQAKKDGYGFIDPVDGDESIFFHSSELVDVKFWELVEGDRVSYVTYNTDRGLNAGKIEKTT